MESRKLIAVEKWKSGYNCAQAVACTYADIVGQDEVMLFKACEALGSGLSTLKRTCGALLGVSILVGFLNSDGNMAHPTTKHQTYDITKDLVLKFENKHSTSQCAELKGLTGKPMILPCNLCISEACELFEELIQSN